MTRFQAHPDQGFQYDRTRTGYSWREIAAMTFGGVVIVAVTFAVMFLLGVAA